MPTKINLMSWISKSLVVLFICCIFGISLSASTTKESKQITLSSIVLNVTNESQLRDTVNNANNEYIIEIDSNIYLSQATPLVVKKKITIQSNTSVSNSYGIYQFNSGIRHFIVENGGELTLENIVLDGENNGGGVQILATSSLIMNDGAIIQKCLSSNYGGGVYINNGSLIMNKNSLIRNNSSSTDYDGGAIYAFGNSSSKSTITLNGGEVLANKSTVYGGGIFLSNYATLNMYDGKISNNIATKMGGGVIVASTESTFTLYGGEISYNTAASGGGIGMYNSGSLFIMKGGSIDNNIATGTEIDGLGEGLGGGLFLDGGAQAEIYAGTFSKNSTNDYAGGHGGAIYTADDTYLTIYNSVIKNNKAIFQGGGVWICNTGRAQTNEFRGTAIYNNYVENAKNGKDVHLDSHETIVTLSNVALGGGGIEWKDELNDTYVNNLVDLPGVINLESEISPLDIEKVLQFATVFITDNTSNKAGGGLAINGYITFGAITPEKINLDIEKKWVGDLETNRPESIKVYLVENGIKQTNKYLVLDKNNNWKSSFKNLNYKDGGENIIAYSIEEDSISNYSVEYDKIIINDEGNYKISITNTFISEIEYTSKKVIKKWNDFNNKDNKRPDNVTVQLYANNLPFRSPIILSEDTNWEYIWNNLPKYNNEKIEIVYKINEIKMGDMNIVNNTTKNYKVDYDMSKNSAVITIINTYIPEIIDLEIQKIWKDNKDRLAKRPKSINVALLKDNVEFKKIRLSEENDWKVNLKKLPVDNYVIKEINVAKGYTSTISNGGKVNKANTKIIVTNTYKKATKTSQKTPDTGQNLLYVTLILLITGGICISIKKYIR